MHELEALSHALGVPIEKLEEHLDLIRAAAKRKHAIRVSDFKLEGAFDCDAVRVSLQEWLDYKQSRNQAYKSKMGVQKILNEFKPHSPSLLIKQIDIAIKNNNSGVYVPDKAPVASDWHEKAGKPISQMTSAERHKYKVPYRNG